MQCHARHRKSYGDHVDFCSSYISHQTAVGVCRGVNNEIRIIPGGEAGKPVCFPAAGVAVWAGGDIGVI